MQEWSVRSFVLCHIGAGTGVTILNLNSLYHNVITQEIFNALASHEQLKATLS